MPIHIAILIDSLLLLILRLVAVTESNICSAYDVVTPGTPVENYRTCSVSYDCTCSDTILCHEWKSSKCGEMSQCDPLGCYGVIGLNLTYECSFVGAQLWKYQDGGYQYLNGSSVNYGFLLPEHAGLYECRNGTNHVVHAQNLTVNGEYASGSE